MKNDIQDRDDIYLLVSEFYKKLLNDANVKHFFQEIVNSGHLETHLQTLVDFWDNILFYSGRYRKNAMQPHLKMHQFKPIEETHFNSWLSMFNNTVDELFNGDNCQAIKSRALSIATVMKIKIFELNK